MMILKFLLETEIREISVSVLLTYSEKLWFKCIT